MSGDLLRRVAAAALLATVALVLAACGSSSNGSAAPVRTTSVDMPQSYRFAPTDIIVDAGATVTWTNSDNFTHSVQFLDGGLPTEPMVVERGGQPVTFTFEQAGTYRYQCSFHPQNMKGTVTVE